MYRLKHFFPGALIYSIACHLSLPGQSVVNAVKKLAADLPEVCVSRNSHVMGEQFSSLEDNRPSPQGTNLQTPSELIR